MADFSSRVRGIQEETAAGGDLGRGHNSGLSFRDRVTSVQNEGNLPEDQNSALGNFGSGIFERIADYVGVSADIVGRTARQIAAPVTGEKDIWEGMSKTPESTKMLRELFVKLGVQNPDSSVDTFMERMGRSTVDSAATLGPIGGGAIKIAKAVGQNAGPVTRFIGDFGKELMNAPVRSAVSEIGAVGGAQLGGDTLGPGGEIPGGMAGGSIAGFTGNQLARVVKGTGKWALGKLGLGPAGGPPPANPIRPMGTDPGMAAQYAKQQLTDDIRAQEAKIQALIAKRTATGSASGGENAFRQRLDRLERFAHTQQDLYWKQVPETSVPIKKAQNNIIQDFQAIRDNPTAIPDRKTLAKFLSLDKPSRAEADIAALVSNPAPSTAVEGMASSTRIRNFISELRALRKQAMVGGFDKNGNRLEPNRYLADNLGKMQDALYEALGEASPGNPALARARAYSKWYNETFYDGPLASVYGKRTEPGETLSTLLDQHGGVSSIDALSRGQRIPVPGLAKRHSIDTVYDPELLKQANQGIDNYIQEIAAGAVDPTTGAPSPVAQAKAVNQYLNAIVPYFKELPKAGADFIKLRRNLTAVLARHAQVQTGATARFAQAPDTAAAVRGLFGANGGPEAVRDLKRRALSMIDPNTGRGRVSRLDGEEAFNAVVIDEVARQSGLGQAGLLELMNPFGLTGGGRQTVVNAYVFIKQPRIQAILQEALGSESTGRLNKLYASAARIAQGDEKFVWRKLPAMSFMTGRIAGAALGRQLAHATGGGNIQTPALMAGITGRWLEDLARGYPPEVLLRLAITDPKWEKVLTQRMPTSTREQRKLARSFQRLISAGEGTRQLMTDEETLDSFEEE